VQFEIRCNTFVLHISTTFESNRFYFYLGKLSLLCVISKNRKLFPVHDKKLCGEG